MSFYFGFNSSEEQEKRRKADLQAIGKSVTEFFWDVAPAHGFEMREGQQDMSFEIIDALIHNQHFAVEAGVGIGKSFWIFGASPALQQKNEKAGDRCHFYDCPPGATLE